MTTPFPHLVIAAGLFAVVLGIPFGLYALLTRGQRRTMREIRAGALQHGWRYRLQRRQGSPTAFRIDGGTRSGLTWILTSGNTSGYDRGWSVLLGLRFPTLGGDVDFAVLPRDSDAHGSPLLGSGIPPGVESRVAAFSGTAASAVAFVRDARELPSGLAPFDAAYQILLSQQELPNQPVVDCPLAQRILHWPPDTVAPHSVLAWRDPFSLQLQARLPVTPNWATISYFLALAEDLIARVPRPVISPAPQGFVDRLVARFLR